MNKKNYLGLVVRLVVDFRNINNEVADTARVTPFVVVPGDQLDKVVIESNSGLSIEDGRVCGTNPIGRDNFFIGEAHNAFVLFAVRSLSECFYDIVVSSALFKADH